MSDGAHSGDVDQLFRLDRGAQGVCAVASGTPSEVERGGRVVCLAEKRRRIQAEPYRAPGPIQIPGRGVEMTRTSLTLVRGFACAILPVPTAANAAACLHPNREIRAAQKSIAAHSIDLFDAEHVRSRGQTIYCRSLRIKSCETRRQEMPSDFLRRPSSVSIAS